MRNTKTYAAVPALALLLAVALTGPAIGQGGANGALEAPSGPSAAAPVPLAALGIALDAGWSATSTRPPAFFWGGPIPVFADDSYTFTTTGQACVSVTDDFFKGDQFKVYDNGNLIGTTPLVAIDSTGPGTGPGVGPDAAYADPTWSSGTFVVGAGSHSITIEVIPPNSFTGGRGYIRVDSPGTALCGPDLVINSITHDPASPDTETNIEFTATVKNVGNLSAGTSVLSFKVGGESPSDPDALFFIEALGPGDVSAPVVRFVTLGVAQGYINTAVADFELDVAESDEGNNTATDSYTVTQAIEPVGIQYSIVTLPSNGELFEGDGAGNPVGSALLAGAIVVNPEDLVYVPNTGFEGFDSFTYRCTDLVTGLFDDAVVDITVSSAGSGLDLTITLVGNGEVTLDVGGSVVAFCTSSPCVNSFGDNDVVKLQARPLGTSTFVSWGGDCSGSSQIFNLNMGTTDKACTATFSP